MDLIHPDGGSITLFGKDNQDITPEDKEKLGVVLSDSGFSGYLRIKDIIPILENMYRQFDSSFFHQTSSTIFHFRWTNKSKTSQQE